MNKLYGASGNIDNFPFPDLHETFYNQEGIEIEVKDRILSVGVDDKGKLEAAKDIARLYLAIWAERQNIKIHVDFTRSWVTKTQGSQDQSLALTDSAKAADRVQVRVTTRQIHIQGRASIISQQMHDSASFTNDALRFQKAQKYPALKSAFYYYNQEVIDDERPLYGVYKALEALTSSLHKNEKEGRKRLAALAGHPFSFVDDVMQTTQVQRHHTTTATRKLSDEECRQRAKLLIDAFADSLPL